MIKRITFFYVITFVLTILLAGLQQAASLSPTFILPQWGPGLAALLMAVFFRQDRLNRRAAAQPASRAATGWRYGLALVIPLLGAAAMLPLAGRLLAPVDAASRLATLTPLWLAGMLFGALGEEIGWRGYLQPLLRARGSAVAVSLVIGPLWALWHMQSWANGPLYMALMVVTMTAYSLVITALIDDAPGGRVALATLFHVGINVGNVPFLDLIPQPGFMALNAAVWLLIAAAAITLRRSHLTGNKRLMADGEAPARRDEPVAADVGS